MDSHTLFLLTYIGLVLLAIGLSILKNNAQYRDIMTSLDQGTVSWFLIAVLPLAVGLPIVLTHNSWNSLPEGLVSFIGWAATVKGLIRLFMPAFSVQMIKSMGTQSNLRIAAGLLVAIGAYMAYVGMGW